MTRNRWAAVGAILGVLFVTLACESATLTPGPHAPLVVDAGLQATVEAV